MELDEAEEAEVVSATVADLVDAITATSGGTDGEGRALFATTSPNWWVGDRTFGGMVVAQALHAACQTVPPELEVHSLHGYFLRPTSPGSRSIHTVERVRDGRSFSVRHVTSAVEGKDVFRLTCSFHAPEEGDEYQLPMGPGIPAPDTIDGIEAPFPFDVRELGATEQRQDGTFLSTRRCWFRTRKPLADDPAIHACRAGLLLGHDGCRFPPVDDGHLGHPYRCQPRSCRLVPPAVAGGPLEPVRPPGAGECRRESDHPRHHARRGRHAAPEHDAGAPHQRTRRTDGLRDATLAREDLDDRRRRWVCLRVTGRW